tara:strand:+ start:921 stop:1541 length:621 start_codon:yes stop_codon:yes gene_type:complete
MKSFNSLRTLLPSTLWVFLLVVLVGWSRYLPFSYPELYNFSPVLALFLVSGCLIKSRLGWFAPVLAVLISDFFLNPRYGANFFELFSLVTLGVYVVIFLLGKSLKRPSLPSLLGGSILSALLFHIVTCSFSWVMNNAYTKNFAGFWQAQIWGEPGYAPSYLFLRNSIFSTILFTLLFLLVFSKLNKRDKVAEKSFGLQKIGEENLY